MSENETIKQAYETLNYDIDKKHNRLIEDLLQLIKEKQHKIERQEALLDILKHNNKVLNEINKDLEKHRIMSSDDFTIKVLKDLLEEN